MRKDSSFRKWISPTWNRGNKQKFQILSVGKSCQKKKSFLILN